MLQDKELTTIQELELSKIEQILIKVAPQEVVEKIFNFIKEKQVIF